ncbi:MAG TPA: hypothetical protein VGF97_17720 [Rhizomicrobium sp.]|jgi:hypothetical protein
MHPNFAALVDQLHAPFERLVAHPPITAARFPARMMTRGVYLFSDGSRHLYVGRSNDIRRRYGRHCNPGATDRTAAFAFRLAREATGKIKATYKTGDGSRKLLMEDAEFAAAFVTAKARIREMDFRWVEETDPVRQCLLEVYCAVVLQTPYNDFDNH